MSMNDTTLSISIWIECPSIESACPGFYQCALHLNHWKTQSERKASPLHFLPVSPPSHNTLWRLNAPAQMHIPSCTSGDHTGLTCWKAEIPHIRAVPWPSCLAGQRWMSCLLGTHILHVCVLHVSKQCYWVFSLSTKAESIRPKCSGEIFYFRFLSFPLPLLEENVLSL